MASLNPEREGFPPKAEGPEMRTPPEETHRFLAEAGLDAALIDPASMKALEAMFSTGKKLKKEEADEENLKPSAAEYRPLMEVQTNGAFHHADSEITMAGLKSKTETNFSVAGSTEKSRDDLILQQLKMQTAMIMDLQSRIDYLANKIHSLAASAPGDRTVPPQYQHPNHQEMYHLMHPHLHPPAEQFRLPVSPDGMIPEPRNVPVPNGPPPPPFRPPRNLFGALCDYFANIASYIQNSRTVQVMRAFTTLHRRHVRVDGALIVKVLLTVAIFVHIFSAKLMSRPPTSGEFWTHAIKFSLVMGMVFVGFLIQSGYISFLYGFFITHKLLDRIYGGEDVDIDDLVWNDPATHGNNANGNNLRNMIPRNHMLGGNIPVPRNGIHVLMDIVILFGSFMLSLLPMWKPEGQRQARMAQAQAQPQEHLNAVAPPLDLDAHAAEDDDDDGAPHAHQD